MESGREGTAKVRRAVRRCQPNGGRNGFAPKWETLGRPNTFAPQSSLTPSYPLPMLYYFILTLLVLLQCWCLSSESARSLGHGRVWPLAPLRPPHSLTLTGSLHAPRHVSPMRLAPCVRPQRCTLHHSSGISNGRRRGAGTRLPGRRVTASAARAAGRLPQRHRRMSSRPSCIPAALCVASRSTLLLGTYASA